MGIDVYKLIYICNIYFIYILKIYIYLHNILIYIYDIYIYIYICDLRFDISITHICILTPEFGFQLQKT